MPANPRRRAAAALAGLAAIVLSLAACAPPAKKPATPAAVLELRPVEFAALPGWQADHPAEALPALARSCARFAKLSPGRSVGPAALAGTIADWKPACDALAAVPAGDDAAARAYLEAWFAPFSVFAAGSDGIGTFTGYYESELKGSRTPDPAYPTPLYGIPDDMITVELGDFRADYKGQSVVGRVDGHKLKPYWSRADITKGALAGRGQELLWVQSPVELYFLQVQGSGRVELPDGSTMRVGYASQNGQPLTLVGRTLVEMGAIPRKEVSMQTIRAWLNAHPDQAQQVIDKDRSYVFFRVIEGDGPIGSQGVALTAGRSLAIDPAYLPLGVPLWLDTTWPNGTKQAGQPLQRLVVAQDTGGAIKGVVRGDVYWGTGEPALAVAGFMNQSGRYYMLLPRPVAEKRRALIAQGMLP
ncbi:MAG: murein transglycosylase A [Dongiaceae bacterium]